jgi:hypothetical protein
VFHGLCIDVVNLVSEEDDEWRCHGNMAHDNFQDLQDDTGDSASTAA